MEPSRISTEKLQPSQLFLSARKLREAREWFDFDAPHYEPVSVIQLEDEVVLIDGHTRVYLAFHAGAEEVLAHDVTAGNHPVVLYADCVMWCKRKGITSIADLDGRIVTHETYERRWIDRCRRVAAVLGN
ncbi:histone acetyltransferase [Halococcus salsus]|uniref:histone acetyltransferase n=1 Tax=Halococcus salsus TaxID=2162894 RepID=UPI00135A7B8D|nr:histone acetyltransferase [Halococcus salsus]